MIGGIISYQGKEAEISNVFNLGKIIGNDNTKNLIIGGIIGRSAKNINIINSYNTGKIETENNITKYLGSIGGDLEQVKLDNCYYLKGTYSVGVGEGEEGTSTGVTELDDISKFPSVLEVVNEEGAFKEDVNNINDGYPILEWQ